MKSKHPLLWSVSFVWCATLFTGSSHADEGMWPFNRMPKEALQQNHGFAVTDAWLDRVRGASVRFNTGGSGSWVSATGLVLTNHHVGADCIHKLAGRGKDYIQDGFAAKTAQEEQKCPDLELNVLVAIDDVTVQIQAAAKPGMPAAAANQAQKEAMATLEKHCSEQSGLRCDVVTLYQGGLYDLYKYKKFTDVRLVFAPEAQIAFYGGDPDNFTFPRFDYDMAIFRVYEGDKPYRPQHFLPWATDAKAGDLVFTSGHPGTTSRSFTVAQREVLRDRTYPMRLADLARTREVLTAYGAQSPEAERQARTPRYGVDNASKALTGYLAGLKKTDLMQAQRHEEAQLRKDPTAAQALDAIAVSQKTYQSLFVRYQRTEGWTLQSKLFGIARHLLRLSVERALPSEKRLREYRDSNLASVELALFSSAPVYVALEQATLTSALLTLQTELGAADPLVVAMLAGKTPALRAQEVLSSSKLVQVQERKRLAADAKAVADSSDPLILLAKILDPEARALRKRFEDEVEGPVREAQRLLAVASFKKYGTSRYPDATFTLRLSWGKIMGYAEDDGTAVDPLTTFGGLFARSDKAGNAGPWELPKTWLAARKTLDGKTTCNVASTNDITGGNSGSPVLDRQGRLVGLIFDGNIQSLAGQFVFDGKQNRAVWVHSAALLEALRKVYGQAGLADELLGVVGAKL